MRLGMIGTGTMAAAMANAAAAQPGLTVAAVLSGSQDRARSFVAEHAANAAACTDMAAFLMQVDAVYIATAPGLHLPAIKAAIGAGLPVLCEKPLTPNRADTEKALALAETAGVALVEAIWPLSLPSYAALKKCLDSLDPDIPRRMTFDFSYPLPNDASAHLLDAVTGGVLLDRAVYGYAAALHLIGPVTGQAVVVRRDGTGLDRQAEIIVDHEAARSIITLSFDHLGANRVEVATGAGLGLLGAPSLGAEVVQWQRFKPGNHGSGRAGGRVWLKSRTAPRRLKHWLTLQRYDFHSFGSSPYAAMLNEFKSTVDRGATQSALIPLEMSRRIAALVDEARACCAHTERAS